MRRRKTVYRPAKTATKGGATVPEARAAAPSRVVTIDLKAMPGRDGVVPGIRVEIASGLYAGELAVVESTAGGVIPAVLVRTDAGRTRRVRTIDLLPVGDPSVGRTPEGG